MRPPGNPFSARTVGWVVGISGASLALALVLTAFSGRLSVPRSVGTDSFSVSAIGHRALTELLAASGYRVTVRRHPRTVPPGPDALWMLLEPPPGWKKAGYGGNPVSRILHSAQESGAPVLLVLPKWRGVPHERQPLWIERAEAVDVTVVGETLDRLEETLPEVPEVVRLTSREQRCESAGRNHYDLRIRQPQYLAHLPEGAIPLVACGPRVLVARMPAPAGAGQLYVVADPDLLNNHGLDDGDAARLILEFIDGLAVHSVIVDETIHGYEDSGSLLSAAFTFPLVLLVLQGLLTLGAFLWAGTGRFGKPSPGGPGIEPGKEVLIDNTAKLIGVAGHTGETLPLYFWQTVRAVARRYLLPMDLSREAMLTRLDRIGAARGQIVGLSELWEEVRTASARRPERVVQTALQLYRWRMEME